MGMVDQMSTHLSSGPSPPTPRRLLMVGALLGATGLGVACSGDGPLVPAGEPQLAKLPGQPSVDRALSIDDLLDDPLFQALIGSIDAPPLAEPLLTAVEALESGQVRRVEILLARASAQADALQDDPAAAAALISWTALERYFEEAELL